MGQNTLCSIGQNTLYSIVQNVFYVLWCRLLRIKCRVLSIENTHWFIALQSKQEGQAGCFLKRFQLFQMIPNLWSRANKVVYSKNINKMFKPICPPNWVIVCCIQRGPVIVLCLEKLITITLFVESQAQLFLNSCSNHRFIETFFAESQSR